MRDVPYVNLARQFATERDVLMAVTEDVFATGQWVGGAQVETFEKAAAEKMGAKFAVAVGSGTDALIFGLQALGIGPGDEVITPPNSFVASTAAIVYAGAKPVFADVLDDQMIDPERIEAAVTTKTRAILPVHLTGRVGEMDEIRGIAERHGLAVIEDAAQSVGSRYKDRFSGTLGHVGAFSAHPLKNLNALGDAGFALTDDSDVAKRLRRLRNNGLVDRDTVAEWGRVSRMDCVQAAILTHKLGTLDRIIECRRANAARYRARLHPAAVFAPQERDYALDTYHTFVIQVDRRDELQAHLAENGIGTAIHYPVPIHLQPAAAGLGYGPGDFPVAESQAGRILSLPIHQDMTNEDIDYVADVINGFYA